MRLNVSLMLNLQKRGKRSFRQPAQSITFSTTPVLNSNNQSIIVVTLKAEFPQPFVSRETRDRSMNGVATHPSIVETPRRGVSTQGER